MSEPGNDNQGMVDERDLLQLFEQRRPDPDRFAVGIAARLAERGGQGGNSQHAPGNQESQSRQLPRAAGWLPIHLSGSKLWIWLCMPALLLAGSWITMVAAASSIRRSLSGGQPTAPSKPRQRSSALRTRVVSALTTVAVCAAMFVPVLLGWPYLFDAIIVAGLASMLALAVLIRGSAHRGEADRHEVARLCIGLLQVLLIFTVVHVMHGMRGGGSYQWLVASSIAVALGIFALIRYAPSEVVGGLMFTGFFLAMMCKPSPASHDHPPTLAQAQAYVAAPGIKTHNTRVSKYRSTLLALRAAGASLNPPADIGERFTNGIIGTSLSTFGLTECARLGLFDDQQWQRIASTAPYKRRIAKLQSGDEPVPVKPYNSYRLRMISSGDLSEQKRDEFAAQLIANWPDEHARTPLATCRLITNGLDWLGRSELADAQESRVHRALVRQQEQSGWRIGGFAELSGSNLDKRLPADDIAMPLIARFGLPADLNLHALRSHLQKRSLLPNPKYATYEGANDDAFEAFAHLQQLDAQMGPLPNRSLWRLLIDERLLWSMIAMVLLCFYSVWVAPPRLRADEGKWVGAMP